MFKISQGTCFAGDRRHTACRGDQRGTDRTEIVDLKLFQHALSLPAFRFAGSRERLPMMRAAGLARLFSPADDRQVEFGDETVRERHSGQTGQSQSAFRFAHFDACAFRQCALTTAVAADPAIRRGILKNVDGERGAGADDERTCEQCVRGQRHQLQCLHIRPHDRPARGKRVGGGTGRRGYDHAIATEGAHLHVVDTDGQFHHFATVGAFQRDVVQRPVLDGFRRARQPYVDVGDHTFVDGIVMVGDPADGRPLGYIPCGSTNDYARSLEIPKEAIEAAEQLVTAAPFSVDVGELNKNYFVYVAAFGIFSDTSYATPQNMKNILGHAAYVLQGMKSLVNVPTYNLKIEFNNQTYTGEFMFGMISNSVSVGGYKSLTSHGVEFDDGLFEGVLIRKIQNLADLQRIINSLLLGNTNETNMVAFRTNRVVIESKEPIAWTLDGEYGGEYTTSEISVHRRAVSLLVSPEEEKEEVK